jgi:hypothetical protein
VHSEELTPWLEEADTIVVMTLDADGVEVWEAMIDVAVLDAALEEEEIGLPVR